MKTIKIKVNKASSGIRLDKFLADNLPEKLSRTFIKKLIDSKNVLVGGEDRNAHYKVSNGEAIKLIVPDPTPLELKAEDIPLDVLYEDADLIVINKTPGISMHPSGKDLTGTIVNALLYHCKDLSGIGGVYRPGIVHRLDKDTSGIFVAAKNDKTHKNLSGQFKNRTVKRKYIAIVRGVVQLDNGVIDLPIARKKKDITMMGISFVDEKKKKAITNYKVIKRFKDFTMLELSLGTGRTHQIRVHLSYIGHPVIGDKMYGSKFGMLRHALHAKTLGFFHPTTKQLMEFDSNIPSDIEELIKRGKL